MKFLFIALIATALLAEIQLAPDGTYVSGEPQIAPDGSYVGSGDIEITPDGEFIAIPEQTKEEE